MVARAVLRYVRISPRKFRLIIPLVKGKDPETAIAILMSIKKGAAKYAIDLLKSAIANAKRKQGVDVSSLYISKLIADHGPMLKRFRAASMGRASMIHKHTSHITLELDETQAPAPKEPETEREEPRAHPKKPEAKTKVQTPKSEKPAAPKKTVEKEQPAKESGKKGKV